MTEPSDPNRPARSWRELDGLLDALLELEPDERDRRLAQIRRDDARLADRLQQLLSGLSRSAGLEALGQSTLYVEALTQLCDLAPGQRLGTWTLTERIGRGGMAEVFKARREVNGALQQAAIKIMAVGLGEEAQRRRFEQETAILARLDDPRLSRLIDAGSTADRRPWLAMEYVEGEAIDRACDDRMLSIAERVRLMIDIALAVDHAHRQLVAHRDLKPGNILLDGSGRVRVLDFGIAKILAGDAPDADATATVTRAYTPRYASPEQLSGSATGIAGDVYQLGLLLHLLLTGTHPFESAQGDPLRLLQAMRDGPSPPSRRWHENAAAEAAHRRAAAPSRLARQLRGDLDSIVIHALQFAPQARYPGARELADDLQRWLDGHPITARSYSRSYRAARWLRRHWLGAAASAAIAVLLIGYAVTATWQGLRLAEERNQAQQARSRAEAIQGFLLQLFGSVDTIESDSRGKSADQLLTEGVERARNDFPDQPMLAAQLLLDLSQVLLRRGRMAEAEGAAHEALALREAELGGDHPELIPPLSVLGDIYVQKGTPDAALTVRQRHLDLARAHHGEQSLQTINALLGMAIVETRLERLDAAEARLRTAIGRHEALFGAEPVQDDPDVIGVKRELLHQLGLTLLHAERFAEAEPLLTTIADAWTSDYGRLDFRTLVARMNQAFALRRLGRFEQARSVFEEVLQAQRELYGDSHWRTAYTLGHLAALAGEQGDFTRSEALWLQAETEARAALEDDHPWPDNARFRAAEAMVKQGRLRQAEPLLRATAQLQGRSDDIAEQAKKLLQEGGAGAAEP